MTHNFFGLPNRFALLLITHNLQSCPIVSGATEEHGLSAEPGRGLRGVRFKQTADNLAR